MKTLCKAVLVVAVLVLAVGVASAAEDNWRATIRTDNGSNLSSSSSQFGVYPNSLDGVDAQDASYPFIAPPGGATAALTLFVIPGDPTKLYTKDIKAPGPHKVWNMRVGSLGDATYANIRMQFFTMGSTILPPPYYQGIPLMYRLKMVDNKGVAGAPINGSVWEIPIPTVHNSTVPYFSFTLPKINAGYDAPTFMSSAYQMELEVGVPEPSALLSLGAGLLGLAGYALRRRR